MSFDSSKPPTDRLSDVEEGEINDEPTTAARSHTKPDKSEPKNATPRSTSGNESVNSNDKPATKAPRKRTLDGHDDDPFEEYERLARRRRRSSSRGSARRSSPRREHRRSASPYSSDDYRRSSRRSASRDKRTRYDRDRFERRRYDSRSPRRVSPRRASPRRTSPRRSSQSRHRAPSSSRHPAEKLPVKRTEPPTEPSNGTR
ncbi:hypothetical protein BJV82DRAFT_126096 [Fennellomyces sp. T-0311]|nr:hypothetical protein BJV82DRAFT_126096 [Fennellomyces sp. T-0311]